MPQQVSGRLDVLDAAGNVTITLDGRAGNIRVLTSSGNELFRYDRRYAAIWVGGTGNEGDVIVRDQNNKERIKLDGGDGDIWVKDGRGRTWFHFDSTYAALWIGGTGNEGDVIVRDQNNKETIKLDGGLGDIILTNADIAEDFSIGSAQDGTAGTVMVVGDDGRLEPCSAEYDRRVVGVVSGAGRYRPGMVLDRQAEHTDHRAPIAVMGKVGCRASAINGPIAAGDMLTTSSDRGRAMRVSDPGRSSGAVIGKALGAITGEDGLVDLLVSLQ